MRWVYHFIIVVCLLSMPCGLAGQAGFTAFGGVSQSASYKAVDSGGAPVQTGPQSSLQFDLADGAVFSRSLIITLVDETDEPLPDRFELKQNFPNPFNPQTTIRFSVPEMSEVKLLILNDRGEVVEQLYAGRKSAGSHQIVWNASHHATGTYLIRLVSGKTVRTQKCILIK